MQIADARIIHLRGKVLRDSTGVEAAAGASDTRDYMCSAASGRAADSRIIRIESGVSDSFVI